MQQRYTLTVTGDSALNLTDCAAECGVTASEYVSSALLAFDQLPWYVRKAFCHGEDVELTMATLVQRNGA